MSTPGQFAIEVNFLTGRYVATSHSDRRVGEWPPHPARLFSALVAAWAEVEKPDSEERSALEWLEAQAAPAITAPEAVPRRTVSHFVPVNDPTIVGRALQERRSDEIRTLTDQLHEALVASGGEVTPAVARLQKQVAKKREVGNTVRSPRKTPAKAALAAAFAMLPEGRGKQERTFPSMSPNVPRVTYSWDVVPPDTTARTLDSLLTRVTRLGHSSSLVSCRVAPDPPIPTHVPATNAGGSILRTVRRGQLAELERQHARHQGVRPRSLPFAGVRYQPVEVSPDEPIITPNTRGRWIVFEFTRDSRAFHATRCVELATAMRRAILSHAEDPIPEGISGHRDDGKPSLSPHIAILPIPYVGYRHADGRLFGVALSVPDGMDRASQTGLYRAIGTWERTVRDNVGANEPLTVTMGSRGVVRMRRVLDVSELWSLRVEPWRTRSRRWLSATPVALPRHPGSLTKGTATARTKAWARAEASTRLACAHVGLPDPTIVELSFDPGISGARKAIHFPAFRQTGREGKPVRRQLVHVSLTFDDPVAGPLMLGTGRFVGLGLMRPTPPRSTQQPADEPSDE